MTDTATPPHRRPWLAPLVWGGLAVLLAVAGWLLLGACGLRWPGGGPILLFCPDEAAAVAENDMLVRERARERALEERLERLRLALLEAPACRPEDVVRLPPEEPRREPPDQVAELPTDRIDPAEPVVPVDEVPTPAVPDEIVPDGIVPDEIAPDEVLPEEPVPEEALIPEPEEPPAGEDAVPEDAVVPEPEVPLPEERLPEEEAPPPEPPMAEAVPDPDEVAPDAPDVPRPEDRPEDRPEEPIPEEQWDDRDLSLLEGCWTLTSDYSVTRRDTLETIRVADWEMCFSANGVGRQTLVFEDGTRCESGIGADFEGEVLRVIDAGHVRCSDGSAITQRVMRCERQPDGSADCVTRHVRPPESPVAVRFRR
jgi:hypothetical protein